MKDTNSFNEHVQVITLNPGVTSRLLFKKKPKVIRHLMLFVPFEEATTYANDTVIYGKIPNYILGAKCEVIILLAVTTLMK